MRTNKERFDFYASVGVNKPEDDVKVIEELADKLLRALFIPTETHAEFVTDKERLKQFQISDKEPVNWGSLHVVEARKADGNTDAYELLIDEAEPEACPTLCAYIERHLKAWGWNVRVTTEW